MGGEGTHRRFPGGGGLQVSWNDWDSQMLGELKRRWGMVQRRAQRGPEDGTHPGLRIGSREQSS